MAAAILVYIFLWRTTIGYRIRAVGLNTFAARYAGINVRHYMVLALLLSGALAGLAGAVQVFGVHHRMFTDGSATGFTGSAGFNGIVAALFGQLHPLGTIPASFFFGALIVGANAMQRAMQIPSALITTLNGLLVVFVVSSEYFKRRLENNRLMEIEEMDEADKHVEARGGGMITELLSINVVIGVLASGIRLATPYLYAGIGETFGQRSGVLNLGLEGQMLLGAYAAFYVVLTTGNLWFGLIAAIIAGAIMGLAMAFVSVTLKAEQGISGIGFFLFGLGMSDLLFQKTLGTVETVSGFKPVYIPVLSDLPFIGEVFFNQNLLVYGAYLLVPLAVFVLKRTTFGLNVRAVGENPGSSRLVRGERSQNQIYNCDIGRHTFRYRWSFAIHRAAQCISTEPDQRHGVHRSSPGLFRRLETVRRYDRRIDFQQCNRLPVMAAGIGQSDTFRYRGYAALYSHNTGVSNCRSAGQTPVCINQTI